MTIEHVEGMKVIDPDEVKRIVDLTTPYDWQYSTPTYPVAKDLRLYELRWTFTMPRDGVYMSEATLGAHVGSHLDTAFHWVRKDEYHGKWYTLDQVPLEAFVGSTVCLDIPKGIGDGIHAVDFERACEEQGLEIQPGDQVLVHTGWGKKFHEEPHNNYYLFWKGPGLDVDGAEWLVEKKIRGYGQDTMGTQVKYRSFYLTEAEKQSGHSYQDHREPVHHLMLENDIFLYEHLYRLDQIAGKRVFCVFMPLRLEDIEASPIRALAFLTEDD